MRHRCAFSQAVVLAMAATAAGGQTVSGLTCSATAVPALVRTEGLTERVGDIVLNCTGGTPGGLIQGDIRVISFGGNITNKLNPATNTIDAVLTVDTGSGERSTGATAALRVNNQFDFAGMNFNLGATPNATFRIANVRVVPPQTPEQPFPLALATNGPSSIRIDNSPLTVGIATRGLLGSYSSTFVCTVSPVPSELTIDAFLRGNARFTSMRFTEGFSEAFQRRIPLSDHGTRLLVRFSGFPTAARLFVPDVLVGSTGITPTAAGDLGLPPNGGTYAPVANGQLLLSLVRNPDGNGAGGVLTYTPPALNSPAVDFNALSEIPLNGGNGVAVFEVVDSNNTTRETVQLPIFLGLSQRPEGGSVTARLAASFGPVSTETTASNGPVPRFQSLTPPPDCQVLGDCNAGIFPRLLVDSDPLTYNLVIGQFPQTRFIRLRNDGGGLLNWSASIQYKNGSGWLSVDPPSGLGNSTVRLDANAAGLAPGIYEATVTIDAGPFAGTRFLPIRLEARNLGPNPGLPPEITSLAHAATFARVALAPGTLATAFGNRLNGQSVTLSVNNIQARIFFNNDTQINFEVPASLPTTGSATVVVTVDGTPGPARMLALTDASPGIFANGILNQDGSANAAANPAVSGSVIQIFMTGLPSAGTKTVRIHDYVVTDLLYAGPAPGSIGLQQVNAAVPGPLQSITSEVSVCAGSVCSPPRPLTVRQP